jgi:SAM-dependent methyltransferase
MRVGAGRRAGLRFDATHGVTTEALVFLGQLDPEAIGPSLDDATHYEPTPVADFEALLNAVPLAPETTTFVDVGCGMGRPLMLASLRPFRQIVGIEISPALCEVGRANLRAFGKETRACRDVRIVRGDARTARLPRGNLLVFLYNPFRGEVMRHFVARLAVPDAREIVVAYHTPVERADFDASGAFEIVTELGCGLLYRRRAQPAA